MLQQPQALKVSTKVSIPTFIGYLFYVRDKAHLMHLAAKAEGSYAKHIALNDFYDGILGMIDEITEASQGDGILFDITIPSATSKGEAVKELGGCLEYVRSNRSIFPHSWQQNELDNIEKLISQTLYKLKFLK